MRNNSETVLDENSTKIHELTDEEVQNIFLDCGVNPDHELVDTNAIQKPITEERIRAFCAKIMTIAHP